MTETIIRLATNVVVIMLAFIWGHRVGRIEGYKEQIEFVKATEQELLKIIGEQVEDSANFINRQQDALEKINDAISGRAK